MPLEPSVADALCPDVLRGNVHPPFPGPRSRALAERLRRAEAPAAHTLHRGDTPPFWDRAVGCLVWDVDGNRFLDLVGGFGAAAVGHQHPRVVAAARAQAERLAHGFGDVQPHVRRAELAERLSALAPFEDARVVFAQSGAESVELALKTAHLATGRPGVVAFRGGFHGQSYGTLAVTGFERFAEPWAATLRAPPARAELAPYARCSRCELGLVYPRCGLACVAEVERAFERAEERFGGVGALLVEPVLGRGGDHVPPEEWLPAVAALARRRGALVIADEIYTGLGRTGELWASQAAGVVPDLLCTGKALGGGYPIAACLMPARLAAAWNHALPETGEAPHSATFYAHPVACAAALATLEVLHREDLVARAAELGESLHAGLAELARLHPRAVREVRGRGLIAGLVLADSGAVARLSTRALAEGLIVLPGGYEGDVISFSPPYVLDTRQMGWALAVLDQALAEN